MPALLAHLTTNNPETQSSFQNVAGDHVLNAERSVQRITGREKPPLACGATCLVNAGFIPQGPHEEGCFFVTFPTTLVGHLLSVYLPFSVQNMVQLISLCSLRSKKGGPCLSGHTRPPYFTAWAGESYSVDECIGPFFPLRAVLTSSFLCSVTPVGHPHPPAPTALFHLPVPLQVCLPLSPLPE